ncbi:hypothetical protein ACNVED_13840 [Legionella sp. D16C41]|uniref:hypothetical protein n=1 Tax=Legionella sp. D16C41 TaxID=3402688 RepID=UPI003AF9A028
MAIIKPAIDGVGTASGVAWPAFGILSAALSLGVGSTTAFILGGICGTIFLLVSIPIAYASYKDLKQQQQNLIRKKEQHETILLSNLIALFAKVSQYKMNNAISSTEFIAITIQALKEKNSDKDKLFVRLLNYLNACGIYNTYNNLEPKLFNSLLQEHVNQFIIQELNQSNYAVENNAQINLATFQGFVGAFGTIAGGGAGLTGLLMGLGLMASFNVIPLAGIAILVTATIISIYMADKAAQRAEANIIKMQWCKYAKSLSRAGDALNLELQSLEKPSQINKDEMTYANDSIKAPQVDSLPTMDNSPTTHPQDLTHNVSHYPQSFFNCRTSTMQELNNKKHTLQEIISIA